MADYEKTMKQLQEIANNVFASMQFTTDFPSGHSDGKISVLDLKVYLAENNNHNIFLYDCF